MALDQQYRNRENGVRPNARQKKLRLYLKALLISLLVFSLLVLTGFLILRSLIKPPPVPEVPTPNVHIRPVEAAYFEPQGDNEDLDVGGGLHAPEGFTTEDKKDEFYTFLVFGIDNGVNTDSIMVASYDGINKEANIIGIPRDSKVDVKRNLKKINAAYPVGASGGGGLEGGVEQLQREIKTIIGFVPDFYVCVDFKAFTKIVDAVGGIDIDAPFHMWLEDPDQNLFIDIPKGSNHLNGAEALKFARYRQGQPTISDYQRIENQQAVIKAVLAELLQPSSLLKIPEFIDIFQENVSTDIQLKHMPWFADQLNVVKGTDALHTYTMPTTGTTGPPMYYELLDEPAVVELINRTINPFKKDIQAKDLDIAGW